jgi:hypothetical protein
MEVCSRVNNCSAPSHSQAFISVCGRIVHRNYCLEICIIFGISFVVESRST